MSQAEKDATKERNKGGRPKKKLDTTSPEFLQAVQAAAQPMVTAALEQFAAKLAEARGVDPGALPTGDLSFMRNLALTFAEIADQGSNRKRVAPEILAKRAESREEMVRLILKAHVDKRPAEYRVIAKTYLEEILIEPYRTDAGTKKVLPTEIVFGGIPNECMVPLNDTAREIHNAFMGAIGGVTGATKGADLREVSVTPGGLVIKGLGQAARRQVSNLEDSGAGSPFDTGLQIRSNDPRATSVRVLGTVQPPAQQNGMANDRANAPG